MNINEMEAGRELDRLVEDKLGFVRMETPEPYSTDIAAAYQMEEKIKDLNLVDEYCMHLNAIANVHWDAGERQPQRWQLIHATPEDRCRAALMAVETNPDG